MNFLSICREAFYKYFILMLLALDFHWHCQWNLINPGKCSTFPKTNKQKINSKIKSLRTVRATANLLMKQMSTDWRALLRLPPGSRGFQTRAHWWYPPNPGQLQLFPISVLPQGSVWFYHELWTHQQGEVCTGKVLKYRDGWAARSVRDAATQKYFVSCSFRVLASHFQDRLR